VKRVRPHRYESGEIGTIATPRANSKLDCYVGPSNPELALILR